jgi:hypothetical protein
MLPKGRKSLNRVTTLFVVGANEIYHIKDIYAYIILLYRLDHKVDLESFVCVVVLFMLSVCDCSRLRELVGCLVGRTFSIICL